MVAIVKAGLFLAGSFNRAQSSFEPSHSGSCRGSHNKLEDVTFGVASLTELQKIFISDYPGILIYLFYHLAQLIPLQARRLACSGSCLLKDSPAQFWIAPA
jgi:hypothetical protein